MPKTAEQKPEGVAVPLETTHIIVLDTDSHQPTVAACAVEESDGAIRLISLISVQAAADLQKTYHP